MLFSLMSANLSLILPCFNEEKNIPLIVEEFLKIQFNEAKPELILVNNGSMDNTGLEIDKAIKNNELKKNNIIIKKIDLRKNQGYGGGIKAGLEVAEGNYLGWAHADLQSPLLDFFKLYEQIKSKKKILGKGFRANYRGYDGVISKLHAFLASKILGHNLKEINAQPKIFSRDVLEYLDDIPLKWTTIDTYVVYVCLENNITINEIEVIFKNRIYGQSKWKNNFLVFVKHIFFNFIYLIQLRFKKVKK